MFLYTVEISDVKSSEDGRFYSFDLYSEGNSLQELIENAVYIGVDQDGGAGPVYEADDDLAEALITEYWKDKVA